MDNFERLIGIIGSGLGTIISFLFGEYHISFGILATFIVIDIITGFMKGAIVGKGLRSKTAFEGMIKKSAIFFVIILAHLVDLLAGNDVPVFRTMAIYFYISLEALSIIENLGLMGVPVPKAIKKYIEQLNQNEDDEEDKKN